jgi:hypothetical protein
VQPLEFKDDGERTREVRGNHQSGNVDAN